MLAAALLTAACGERGGERDCAPPARKGLSGYCVPRWVSLKRGEVFARRGPGADYAALWVYRVRGLPVQVVAETTDWRRICDPQGGVAWVHRSMIDGRRTVLTRAGGPVAVFHELGSDVPAIATINDRAIATLDHCVDGECRIKVGGLKGWVEARWLWGAAEAAQCR